MNSDAHSCMVSLASFEIFAVGGRTRFMIRPTFATGSNLSCSSPMSISKTQTRFTFLYPSEI
ncbi:hypothetical protein HanHA300_Chr03g0084391 [Helianthus annuus]|nr:hypothetical protein HanHA300_Chr03g0084391 [Helianthus annuus]KAJ0607359.1 hypothetical protein HanHA89_Chr03g0095891 [Helianthus annuus]KAJ0767414.1 hypothetical protein HanLR1_Chr03g0089151 [Helianthus annuus]